LSSRAPLPNSLAELLVGEAVEAIAALEAREARLLSSLAPVHPGEVRLIGRVEPGEHVLQDVAVDGGVVGHLRADGLQLGFLVVAGDGAVAPLPGGDALLQRGVVERTAQPQHALTLIPIPGQEWG
jgi:hypothetical protein